MWVIDWKRCNGSRRGTGENSQRRDRPSGSQTLDHYADGRIPCEDHGLRIGEEAGARGWDRAGHLLRSDLRRGDSGNSSVYVSGAGQGRVGGKRSDLVEVRHFRDWDLS